MSEGSNETASRLSNREQRMLLIHGYSRTSSNSAHIIPPIIVLIFKYQQFEGIWSTEYTGDGIQLSEDDTKAETVVYEQLGQSVRATDAIPRGQVTCWELTAYATHGGTFLGVVSSEQTYFDRAAGMHGMPLCWGVADSVREGIIQGAYRETPSWNKPHFPRRTASYTVRFIADYTEARCKLSIWYDGEKLNKEEEGYTFLLPALDEAYHWYPCASPAYPRGWVKLKYP